MTCSDDQTVHELLAVACRMHRCGTAKRASTVVGITSTPRLWSEAPQHFFSTSVGKQLRLDCQSTAYTESTFESMVQSTLPEMLAHGVVGSRQSWCQVLLFEKSDLSHVAFFCTRTHETSAQSA